MNEWYKVVSFCSRAADAISEAQDLVDCRHEIAYMLGQARQAVDDAYRAAGRLDKAQKNDPDDPSASSAALRQEPQPDLSRRGPQGTKTERTPT